MAQQFRLVNYYYYIYIYIMCVESITQGFTHVLFITNGWFNPLSICWSLKGRSRFQVRRSHKWCLGRGKGRAPKAVWESHFDSVQLVQGIPISLWFMDGNNYSYLDETKSSYNWGGEL